VLAGGRIERVLVVGNPDKLTGLAVAAAGTDLGSGK
jgi:hypothetical protein